MSLAHRVLTSRWVLSCKRCFSNLVLRTEILSYMEMVSTRYSSRRHRVGELEKLGAEKIHHGESCSDRVDPWSRERTMVQLAMGI